MDFCSSYRISSCDLVAKRSREYRMISFRDGVSVVREEAKRCLELVGMIAVSSGKGNGNLHCRETPVSCLTLLASHHSFICDFTTYKLWEGRESGVASWHMTSVVGM